MMNLELLKQAVGTEYFSNKPKNKTNHTLRDAIKKQPHANKIVAALKPQPHANKITTIHA